MNSRLERERPGDPVWFGPEQRVRVMGARGDASSRDEAALDRSAFADFGAVPDRALYELRPGAHGREAQDARPCEEVRDRNPGENPGRLIEDSGSRGEGPTARERFERRAEEIARAAEVGKGTFVEHEADLLAAGQHRLPDIGDERGFPFGDPAEDPRRQNADARVKQGPHALTPEARDGVAFGLKRRVPIGLAVFDGEQCRTPTTCGVCLRQPVEVEIDRCIAIDDEEVSISEPVRGVLQGAGGSEDRILPEELQLRELRGAIAKVALDFVAEVMEIDARFTDALEQEP